MIVITSGITHIPFLFLILFVITVFPALLSGQVLMDVNTSASLGVCEVYSHVLDLRVAIITSSPFACEIWTCLSFLLLPEIPCE